MVAPFPFLIRDCCCTGTVLARGTKLRVRTFNRQSLGMGLGGKVEGWWSTGSADMIDGVEIRVIMVGYILA